MKRAVMFSYVIWILMLTLFASGNALAAMDGFYYLEPTASLSWDGTIANRQVEKSTDYSYTYGDEASVTYTLPVSFGAFPFYGQTFTQITADTNGNIWFGNVTGAAHSFNLASNGRGPVIAAWNNDLSSYYYGGVFIQHKTSPERVVVEWQTETYTTEGLLKPNNFEVVLYPNGDIRLDYKTFSPSTTNKDFGSGVSFNDNTNFTNLTAQLGSAFGLAGKSYTLIFSYPITTTPGANGTIVPNSPAVHHNASQTFSVVPNIGYHVKDIFVNGDSIRVVENPILTETMTYTFTDVTAKHTISAIFERNRYPITANAQGYGYICNNNVCTVNAEPKIFYVYHGDDIVFNVTHSSRYKVLDVFVDNDAVPSTMVSVAFPLPASGYVFDKETTFATYTFSNVTRPREIKADFSKNPCSNKPVRLLKADPLGADAEYFLKVQDAYNAIPDGGSGTIQSMAEDIHDNFSASRNVNATLKGGYSCKYSSPAEQLNDDIRRFENTLLVGAPSITGGDVKIMDFQILGK